MPLDVGLSEVPGTVSVWFGPPGGPARFVRGPDEPHYAASLMKLAVLVALHRAVDEGLDPGTRVEVTNQFASAGPGGGTFGCRRSYDSDDQVWDRLGGSATVGWLAERMIIRSSNLATNLLLAKVGLAAVADVWPRVGATASVVTRGIEDTQAAEAGLANLVSVADLARLLAAITLGADPTPPTTGATAPIEQAPTTPPAAPTPASTDTSPASASHTRLASAEVGPAGSARSTPPALASPTLASPTLASPALASPEVGRAPASPAACRRMLDTLLAQEHRDDLAAGLPPHVPVAHKSGWIMGARHAAGVVFPPDADPFILAVCASTPWAINRHDDKACQLVAQIAAAAWSARHPRLDLGTDPPA